MEANGHKHAVGTVSKPWVDMDLFELREAYQELLASRAEVIRQKDELFDRLQGIEANVLGLLEGR